MVDFYTKKNIFNVFLHLFLHSVAIYNCLLKNLMIFFEIVTGHLLQTKIIIFLPTLLFLSIFYIFCLFIFTMFLANNLINLLVLSYLLQTFFLNKYIILTQKNELAILLNRNVIYNKIIYIKNNFK